MGSITLEGRTILFVSHNMSAVPRLCSHAILLHGGQLVYQAPSAAVVDRYLRAGSESGAEKIWTAQERMAIPGPFIPRAVRVRDATGAQAEVVKTVCPFSIEIEYELRDTVHDLSLQIKLYTLQGEHLFTTSERDAALNYDRFMVKNPGRYLSRCRVPANLLNRGSFVVGISAAIPNVHWLFWDHSAVRFAVDDAGGPGSQWAGDRGGFFRPVLHWDVLAS